MDAAVQQYIDDIDPAVRPLFDRFVRLIVTGWPDAAVTLSYRMPTFSLGHGRLHVGVWQHGVSLYGWPQEADFVARHPALRTSKGTLRIRPADAAAIPDEEFTELFRAALQRTS